MALRVVAGEAVYDHIQTLRSQMVRPSRHTPGCWDSASLVEFQRRIAGRGFVEAEIVRSNYGYGVRYASGLQNFGLIYSARARQVDGTLADAIDKAQRWAAADPMRRYVTYREE